MKTKVSVHLNRGERRLSAESALLFHFDTDVYSSLGFPSGTVLTGTVTNSLDHPTMAVSDGARFWLGTVRIVDGTHICISNDLGSKVFDTSQIQLFELLIPTHQPQAP